jgi:hypothetical protein
MKLHRDFTHSSSSYQDREKRLQKLWCGQFKQVCPQARRDDRAYQRKIREGVATKHPGKVALKSPTENLLNRFLKVMHKPSLGLNG